jgi:SagB-type dehydrogenase family enzyme
MLLWHACRQRSTMGDHRSHRAAPSAGGLHPVSVVIQRIANVDGAFLYDPVGHQLLKLEVGQDESRALMERAEACLPCKPATLLWLVGAPGRTAAKYLRPDSLIKRDAGFLAATITLVATAMMHKAVPLGLSGFPHLNRLTDWSTEIDALGAINIGQ